MELVSRRHWAALTGIRWGRLDPSLRFAVATFVVARIWFVIWPLVISAVVPVAFQNINLFGEPVLAAFDLGTSARHVYSRQVDGATLTFRAAAPGYVTDQQTGSIWSLADGRAQAGTYAANSLHPAPYTVEDLYPYHGVSPDPNPILTVWERFDAKWYLSIAERGYSQAQASTVYFPLYPFLIWIAGSLLLNHYLVGAILISNVALIGALYLLYKLTVDLVGDSSARRALVYLLIFPTSFFLFAPYTESLFLFLSLAALYAGERRLWVGAGVFGALAALTRLQGIVLILPLAYMAWTQLSAGGKQQVGGGRILELAKGRVLSVAALLLIPLSTASFLAATNLSLLTSYEGQLHAEFVWPWDNVLASISLIGSGGGSVVDVLNLAATLVFVVMCCAVWFKLPRQYAIYAFCMLLAPMFRMTTLQPLVSMTRYVLVLFSIIVVWAAWGKNQWVNRAILYVSLPLNLYLSAQFFMWGWVA